MHSHLGVLGVTGFLMRDVAANPLDYVEGGKLNDRRKQLSEWLDSTNPDLSAFAKRGGRMIVTIGTNDTLASPGAQLAYYQSVIDKMGRSTVDGFARLFVVPQAGHGLSGTNYGVDGKGSAIPVAPLPNQYDRLGLLREVGHQQEGSADAGDRFGGRQDVAALLISGISGVPARAAQRQQRPHTPALRDSELRSRLYGSLVIDIGGNSVKFPIAGESKPRKFPSGPALTPRRPYGVRKLSEDWTYDSRFDRLSRPGP